MKCRICGGALIQKSRRRLFSIGILLSSSIAIACFAPIFWAPGIIMMFAGIYLIVWATLGKGCWCRNCKRFNLF